MAETKDGMETPAKVPTEKIYSASNLPVKTYADSNLGKNAGNISIASPCKDYSNKKK